MKNVILLCILTILLFSCTNQKQRNWNQYLGPDRNATLAKAEIMRSWPEGGPAKVWECSLGPGYGGASIFDDEVFLLDRIKGESDVLRCIDLNTGKEKWNYSYAAPGELPYPGSRSVPAVDENYIWCVGPHGHFNCIDKKTQQSVWSHNMLEEYGGDLQTWGFSLSPIVFGDLVLVAPQGEEAGVVAFNKTSGDVVWESRPFTGQRFHVSPTLGKYGGIDQIIMISSCFKGDSLSSDEVVSFEVNTGRELWRYEGIDSHSSIAPPVAIDENRLFLTSCAYNDKYDPISILLDISSDDGEKFQITEMFRNEDVGCKMHPPVFINDHFYINNNGKPNELVCLTQNGERVWEKGSAPGFDLGSLILIDGLIINQNGKNGDIHLIEPTVEGYKEVGKASFFNAKQSQAWAPMAFSKGKLLVRDTEKMVCVDLKEI
ncbi:PQQ-binding-like beta-propeller repeat protein [Prolixibacteraceae bacterium Z1-6]|uniref:PQQ-binding-like beta-propeller repeat protein n=1 Tax=Draconibacterium aestuarii TaxID=2998507 RepID=A0A9X3F4Z7_9BACT|nr:PQQ-binding-like beta-propeller repeat protein [Prolixibacteraceae bacterium Z1-6]